MHRTKQSIRYVSRELIARLCDSWQKEDQMTISTTFDKRGSGIVVSIPFYYLTLIVTFRGDKFDYSYIKWEYTMPDGDTASDRKDIPDELTNREIVDMCMEAIDSAKSLFEETRIRK